MFGFDLSFLGEFKQIDLEDIRQLYYHKWVKINNDELFVKYIYENFYSDPPFWMDYVFIGRDRNGNYAKVSIKKHNILEDLNILYN